MDQGKYVIGISCIGSGVGQSVVNSLRLSDLPIKTVGLGTNPFAYGAYDCDCYDYTPNIYSGGYINALIEKCLQYSTDLLIPGLDDEALILSRNIDLLTKAGIKCIVSKTSLIEICRDKEKMSNELNKIINVFVKSFDPDQINSALGSSQLSFPFIVKPKGGFASRGVKIIRNQNELIHIKPEHIVQELAVPHNDDPNYPYYMEQLNKNINAQIAEISIQLVYGVNKNLIGRMASYNKLNNGVPIEILPIDNESIWDVTDQLTPHLLDLGLTGPINIQGRLTNNGLKLFELNPRFTGITGLRALMGFNEVEACVKDWLGIGNASKPLEINSKRFGTRQTADKSIPIDRNNKIASLFNRVNRKKLKTKKTVLITGATGYLGQNLVDALSKKGDDFELIALTQSKEDAYRKLGSNVQEIYDVQDMANSAFEMGQIDLLLHLGFARPYQGEEKIFQSLKFTHDLFTRAACNHIPEIINISSQSVYGQDTPPPWTEDSPVIPLSCYAGAKYATELLLNSLKRVNHQMRVSSLRLGTLSGGAKGLVETDFLAKIVKQAINGEPIKVVGGMQKMERLDIRDAVSAIVALINSDSEKWKPVYNVGSGKVQELIDIVKRVVNLVSLKTSKEKSNIIVEEERIEMAFGMVSELFYTDMRWKPAYTIENSIESLIYYYGSRDLI